MYHVASMATDRRIRVLVAKPGMDGHDRGIKVIARALRDAGMEVIYTGLRQTPEMIVNASLHGIIPDQDVASLKEKGVAAVFQPGTPMEDIVRFIRENVRARGAVA
jgi:methylmalonyl-CoA mutase C-terminal domain/subunit